MGLDWSLRLMSISHLVSAQLNRPPAFFISNNRMMGLFLTAGQSQPLPLLFLLRYVKGLFSLLSLSDTLPKMFMASNGVYVHV